MFRSSLVPRSTEGLKRLEDVRLFSAPASSVQGRVCSGGQAGLLLWLHLREEGADTHWWVFEYWCGGKCSWLCLAGRFPFGLARYGTENPKGGRARLSVVQALA